MKIPQAILGGSGESRDTVPCKRIVCGTGGEVRRKERG